MQTFLPEATLQASAQALDRQRLGKQRLEAKQILSANLWPTGPNGRWRNHPAVLQWRGAELALAHYGLAVCSEWKLRGYQDQMFPQFDQAIELLSPPQWVLSTVPSWYFSVLRGRLSDSHRAMLCYKDPVTYHRYMPDWQRLAKPPCKPEYFWPTQHGYSPPECSVPLDNLFLRAKLWQAIHPDRPVDAMPIYPSVPTEPKP